MGMKEGSIRSDAENQRYRLLIRANRERRRQQKLQTALGTRQSEDVSWTAEQLALDEIDWKDLTDVHQAYEPKCLKIFLQGRVHQHTFLRNPTAVDLIHYHTMATMNNITALMSFFLSVRFIQSLPKCERRDLCQRNIRSLILLNANELNQLCFSDASQVNSHSFSSVQQRS